MKTQTDYNAQSPVAIHDEVPFKTRQAVIENRISDELADVKSLGEVASKTSQIATDQQGKIRRLVGEEKYERFRAEIDAENREKARIMLPPRGPQMSREELRKLQTQRKERGIALLRKLGVELSALKALNEAHRKSIEQFIPPSPMRDGQIVSLILPENVPEDIRLGATKAGAAAAAWSTYRPPYAGAAWSYSWSSSGFGVSFDRFLGSNSGLVGSSTELTNGDAGDSDYASVDYRTSVGFWYQMPAAGLLDVWIEGQPAKNRHYISLSNEWGWSDSSVAQRNYLTLKGTAGNTSSGVSLAQMSSLTKSGYTDGYWDNQYLTIGATYWAHLYSDIAFAAGQWVYVEIGNHNWNYAYANDVSTFSSTDFRWYLKSVWIKPS